MNPQVQQVLQQAVSLHQAGQLPEAEAGYRQVLALDPNNADAFHLLGLIATAVGNHPVARQLIEQAIALNKPDANFQYNYGVVLQELGELAEAAEAYRKTIRLDRHHRKAYENLGVVLSDQGDLKSARSAYRNALKEGDVSPIARHNLGTIERELGNPEVAREHFAKALSLNPAYPEVHLKYAHSLFEEGRLSEGFAELEWRNYTPAYSERIQPRSRPVPVYPGFGLKDSSVFVSAEQGLGDEIMFASCLPELIAETERCVVECDPRLLPLYRRSFPGGTFVAVRDACAHIAGLGPFDWRIPSAALLRHFCSSSDKFPEGVSYLIADADRRVFWRDRLADLGSKLKVGISWHGGTDSRQQTSRSALLKEWGWLFSREDVSVLNLQYGNHQEEISRYGEGLISLDGIDPLKDQDDFAALISELDLVISIDNSTVHLAGALGVATWVLLPTAADWRWMDHQSTHTPWYSSLRLFRQKNPRSWRDVLDEVRKELDNFEPVKLPDPAKMSSGSEECVADVQGGVLLLNDTNNWYHWGCSCTSIGLHQALNERYGSVESIPIAITAKLEVLPGSTSDFDDADVFERFRRRYPDILVSMESAERIVINGEGTLHGSNTAAVGLLYLAYIGSKWLGKPVEIVNHSCYPGDESTAFYQKVYEQLERVAIREPVSAEIVRGMGVDVTDSFDCLPLFVDRTLGDTEFNRQERITLSGCVAYDADFLRATGQLAEVLCAEGYEVEFLLGAFSFPARDDFEFVEQLHAEYGASFSLRNAPSEVEWLQAIGESRLLISGRFHHSIAAAWLGTPFIVVPSNTRKIEGLMQVLEIDAMLAPGDDLPGRLRNRAQQLLESPESALISESTRTRIRERAKRNFDLP